MPKFTEIYLDSLKPTAARYEVYDALLPAFSCRVGKRTKTFQVLTSSGGRIKIGHYPRIKLADAREKARDLMALPNQRPKRIMLSEAIKTYLDGLKLRPTTIRYYRQFLKKLEAKHGSLDIAALTPRMLADATTSPHMHQALVIFFGWARGRALIDKNPMETLKPPGRFNRRTRILESHEIRTIWLHTKDMGNYGKIVRLCLLMGQRKEQLIKGQIRHMLLAYTSDDTKNKQNLITPLTAITSKYFPIHRISNWSRPKEILDKRCHFDQHFQIRDLRRTFATVHAQIGTPPHLIELLLGHVSPKALGGPVGVTYNVYNYLAEMRIALENYEKHLETIIGQPLHS